MLGIGLILIIGALVLVMSFGLIAAFKFTGEDHSEYDSPRGTSMANGRTESAEHAAAAREISDGMANPPPAKGKELLQIMRSHLDERGESFQGESEVHKIESEGVKGEWVIAPNTDPSRRMLYIHGGGYVMGSPRSHRRITNRMSEISRAAVFAVEYRLMPESSRMDGIEDCRKAYDWILANGPHGGKTSETATTLIVAGDSSGGNLALSTIAWARDTQRQAADAVVALSPQTDATFASPSLKRNVDSDVMQGKSFGPVVRAPQVFSLWLTYAMHKVNPSSMLMSPLLGDLSNLPPTLLQASESEMFLDDSIRYANKATDHGSTAVAQTWPFIMHVWHNFDVPEADHAFEAIREFLDKHAP